MPFAYIVTTHTCLEKEYPTFKECFESTQRLVSENIRHDTSSRMCAVVSAQKLGEKEQAMLVLAIL
jgi:hypothetical protein